MNRAQRSKVQRPKAKPSEARTVELSEVFFALSDPTRLHVVQLLAGTSSRASDLAEDVGASRSGMSRHLRILRKARVVREEADPEDGRARLVALDPAALDQVRHFVDQVSCVWQSRLDAFRIIAEQRALDSKSKKAETPLLTKKSKAAS